MEMLKLGGVIVVVAILAGIFLMKQSDIETHISDTLPAPVSSVKVIEHRVVAATTTVEKIKHIVNPNEGWKKAIATVFWVGEKAGEENGFIANDQSAWDEEWEEYFGGVDVPDERCGYEPCDFAPKENPFYVALPYNDLDDEGLRRESSSRIPWNNPSAKRSVLKNRWIEVRVGSESCFGQWEDVGPFIEDDIEYVFGTAVLPLNKEGEQAGIDLSPALRDCLKIDGSADVAWRHVEAKNVPAGPWMKIVTTR